MSKIEVRSDIDEAAGRLSQTMGSKREIRRLPEVLWENETVEMLAAGNYGGGMGLIVMTDSRLFFFKHGVMSQTLSDFPYDKVSSVEWHGGMMEGSIAIYSFGVRTNITNVPKADGKTLADALRARLMERQAKPEAAANDAPPDLVSRLATLDQLRAAGALSDAEYDERRTQILDSL